MLSVRAAPPWAHSTVRSCQTVLLAVAALVLTPAVASAHYYGIDQLTGSSFEGAYGTLRSNDFTIPNIGSTLSTTKSGS